MFFWNSLAFFYDPTDVGNLISGSSAFSKSRLDIWKLSVHILLKPSLENFGHYFDSMWDECNCAVVWTLFGTASKKWQPTPVFLPGESHGQRSLVVYSPWGCKESDMTERLHFYFFGTGVKTDLFEVSLKQTSSISWNILYNYKSIKEIYIIYIYIYVYGTPNIRRLSDKGFIGIFPFKTSNNALRPVLFFFFFFSRGGNYVIYSSLHMELKVWFSN